MSTYYQTKDGDVLDWICWMHYGQRRRLKDAARQLGFYAAEVKDDVLEKGVQALNYSGTEDLQGIVEQILEANPGLAKIGPILPAGIQITLPDLAPQTEDTQTVQLWDE